MEQTKHYNVNSYIGLKIKNRRNDLGLTQQELGNVIGISFQQIQKYEKGSNKINAQSLFELSRFLKVPVGYFFDGFETFSDNIIPTLNESYEDFSYDDTFTSVETLNLIKAYYKITDQNIRKKIINMVKAMHNKEL